MSACDGTAEVAEEQAHHAGETALQLLGAAFDAVDCRSADLLHLYYVFEPDILL